jgi:hypothetical protein
MLLFVLWAALIIAILFGAGYSHYRYRIKNNQYYERLFAKNYLEESIPVKEPLPTYNSYAFPALTLMIVCLLVPISLAI